MATDYGAEVVEALETLYFVLAVLLTAELVTPGQVKVDW